MNTKKVFIKFISKRLLMIVSILFFVMFNSIYVTAKTANSLNVEQIVKEGEQKDLEEKQQTEEVQEIEEQKVEEQTVEEQTAEEVQETEVKENEEQIEQNPTLEEFILELVNTFYEEESSASLENPFLIGEKKGYLKGIPNRNKEELLTKGMTSRILCNVLHIPPVYSKDVLFQDIKDQLNNEYMKAAYAEYLIDGLDEKKFEPEHIISRNEFIDIIKNIKEYSINPNEFKSKMKNLSSNTREEKIKKLLSVCTYKSPMEKVPSGTQMGMLEKDMSQTYINGYQIPSFTYKDSIMIALADLKYYGFDIAWNGEFKKISIYRNENSQTIGLDSEAVRKKEEKLLGKPVLYTTISAYIGNRKVPCYSVEDITMIYLNDLVVFGDLQWDQRNKEAYLYLNKKGNRNELNVELVNNHIINHNSSTIDIDLVHVWYDEKNNKISLEEDRFFGIPQSGSESFYLEKYDSYEEKYYLGTVIKRTNLMENPLYEENLKYIQSEKMIDYICSLSKDSDEYLFSLVKPSLIIATMKWEAGGFEKGEKVEILYGENGSWYQCKSVDTGKEGKIPWGSASIPKDPPTNKDEMTKEQLEAYVNKKGFKSNTDYFVWTDLDRQITHVFQKENGRWTVLRSMLCSTGRNITPTPRGFFTIKERGAYFGDGYMCKNWVQVWGDYLYHSVLMDVTGTYLLETNVLGKRASHGCMRFSVENSKWFYDTIPRNTTVWIN